MTYQPQPEKRFRSSPLDASTWAITETERLGQFDRHTLVLWLSEDVASVLDSKGGTLPSYSVELPDSLPMRGFSTHVHETIHYWQTVGSTLGFIYSLADSTATFTVLDDLCASAHRFKPVLRSASHDASADHPLHRIRLSWADIDNGCDMLDDPVNATARLEHNSSDFISLGHCLLSLCVNTAGRLGEGFDPHYAGLINPESWLGVYDQLAEAQRSGLERGSIVQVPLGLRDLMEGQARISEIQHRDLTQQATSWTEVAERGWLRGIYGRAFSMFLKVAELPAPASPWDNVVYLFLLLCDIALNPSVGYAESIDPHREFVHDFHPGVRFMMLCRAVFRDADIIRSLGAPSVHLYESLSARLCEPFSWKTPTQVAQLLIDRWNRSPKANQLAEQDHTRVYGSADVHRRFLIGEHRSYLETRAQIPHFFYWPAWSVVVFEDDPEYASTINEVLDWHRPPFTAHTDQGVNTIEIARLKPADRAQFASDYFATLSLCDLTRQWVALSGEFDWNSFDWKRPLSPGDIGRLKERFHTTYAVSIDDIKSCD